MTEGEGSAYFRSKLVKRQSVICTDTSVGLVYSFPNTPQTKEITATLIEKDGSTKSSVPIILSPPLDFSASYVELNATKSLILVVGGPANAFLSCVDVSSCYSQISKNDPNASITARSFSVASMLLEDMTIFSHPGRGWALHSSDFFSRSRVFVIRRAHWHPMSPRHILLLTRDSNLYLFDVLGNTQVSEQFWHLSDKFRVGSCANLSPPVSFACTLGKDARGWDSCSVHFVHEDGGISVLCPVVPFHTSLSSSQVRQMTLDAPPSKNCMDWLSNLVPVPPVEKRGYVTSPFSHPDDPTFVEPFPLLRDVVKGTGETRLDLDYDIFVGAHNSLGCLSPTVLIRTASSGVIDCFALYKPAVPSFADCVTELVESSADGYFHVDSVTLKESKSLFVVQDSARVCDFIVLQSESVHLLHIDYSLSRQKEGVQQQLPYPALCVELCNRCDHHFSGGTIMSRPGAQSFVALCEDVMDESRILCCMMPSLQVLKTLQRCPEQFRADCASALVPVLRGNDYECDSLLKLANQLNTALTEFGTRIHDLEIIVKECHKRVSVIPNDDATEKKLQAIGSEQLQLKKTIEELCCCSVFAPEVEKAINSRMKELDVMKQRVELRDPILSKWRSMKDGTPQPQDYEHYEAEVLSVTKKIGQLWDDLQMLEKFINRVQNSP